MCGFSLDLGFCVLFCYLVPVFFTYVVLDFIPSVLRHEIGSEECLQNCPFLGEVGCKTLTESVNQSTLSSDETGPYQSSEGELTILFHVVIQVDTVNKRNSKSVSQNNHCMLYILLPNNQPTSTY